MVRATGGVRTVAGRNNQINTEEHDMHRRWARVAAVALVAAAASVLIGAGTAQASGKVSVQDFHFVIANG